MGRLSLGVLGTFEAALDARPLRSFRTKSVQALLIYLATQPGTAQRREHLMALLWPGLPQKSAQANLRQTLYLLRQAIPEVDGNQEGETVPFLLADRSTVQVNPEATFELDAARFESLLAGPLKDWPAAVDLYRGDFLEGFYLPDSPEFEAWVLARREAYRRRLLDALERLAEEALDDGELGPAETYARRQVDIDDLRESGHRQLMQALAMTGKRTDALAQFNTLRQRMDEELAAEPSADTVALYELILSGEAEPVRIAEPAVAEAKPVDLAASFPISGSGPERPLFVGRERQLAWLDDHLQSVLDGQIAGNVVFLAGEAGMGKTSLMQAFADKATDENPSLLVTWGACNAFIGPGDAYLPFRQALDLLAGDVEGAWRSGTITTEQARRLWMGYPDFGQALVDRGRAVATNLVNGRALLRRGTDSFAQGAPWLARLENVVERAGGSDLGLSESRIHQECAELIVALAKRQPLVLFFDDLQWADSTSLNLLFHLNRSLVGSRALIVGAYRPEDVAMGRDGDRHSLERVVAEIKRLSGNALLDLAQEESDEKRAFVDALLDSDANSLDEVFRRALLAHTGGQPLFTVEMLRYLQDRDNLVHDDDGAWTAGPRLAWDALPDRIEGVIEARIGRLDDELRELLNVAAVEGEDFTAQVIARIQHVDERGLLRTLSGQLEKKHHLIRERSALKLGRQLLSRYRFSHGLFQQYLYDELSVGERQLLHGEIADILEDQYKGRTDEIAILLARHYRAAREDERALPYLLQSGDQARNLYALEQAAGYYEEASEILREQGDSQALFQLLMKLGQTYHSAFDYDRSAQAYQEAFQFSAVSQDHIPAWPSTSTPSVLRFSMAPHPFRTLDYTEHDQLSSGYEMNYIQHLFSGLLQLSPGLDVLPDVAASWRISDDGLTYRFYLRDDVVWSDGQPVTAHDFDCAWRRILDTNQDSTSAKYFVFIRGARDAGRSGQFGVEVLDDWTLEITLDQPVGHFLLILATTGTPIPKHVLEEHGDAWADPENIVTNGPYMLKQLPQNWHEGESVLLTRYPDYHGVFAGNVYQVEWRLYSSAESVLQAYENDELDICYIRGWLPLQQYRWAMQMYSEQIHSYPRPYTMYLAFDTSRPPFDDVMVRRAFAHSIDRQIQFDDRIPVADGGLVPPGLPGHVPRIALPYDLDKARRLLASAGYPEGRGFPVINGRMFDYFRDLREHIRKLERVWRDALGVSIRWENSDYYRDKPYHMTLAGWLADNPDPDDFLRLCRASWSNWDNEDFDNLVASANRVLDQRERLPLYRQAEEILVAEAPIIPLYYLNQQYLLKPWVKNWRPREFGRIITDEVIIEPH